MLNQDMKSSMNNSRNEAMKPRAFRPSQSQYKTCDDYVRNLYRMYKGDLDRSMKVLNSSQAQSRAYTRAARDIQNITPLINRLFQQYNPQALMQ